jgi:hypothetical protein
LSTLGLLALALPLMLLLLLLLARSLLLWPLRRLLCRCGPL